MENLPKSKQNYLDEIHDIERDLIDNSNANGNGTVRMLGLLVEAVVDLKEAVEPLFEPREK